MKLKSTTDVREISLCWKTCSSQFARFFCFRVIILTYGRSGSTLIGEIFKTDPDIIYLFEPFRVKRREEGGLKRKNRVESLLKINDCNFSEFIATDEIQPGVFKRKEGFSRKVLNLICLKSCVKEKP